MNKKIYGQIDAWRNKPIEGKHPYVYLDGIWLKRTWGGEVRNVAVLVAVGVNSDGYREVLGVMEGAKEDKESWAGFLRWLKGRGLQGVRLFISDKCLGQVEALGEFYPEAAKLDGMRLSKAAGLVRAGIAETLAYMAFPREHWRSLRTNNPLERVMRELRRRTRVVGCFPDGDSAVMLVGARLRHLAGTKWGTRRYLDMGRLVDADDAEAATG